MDSVGVLGMGRDNSNNKHNTSSTPTHDNSDNSSTRAQDEKRTNTQSAALSVCPRHSAPARNRPSVRAGLSPSRTGSPPSPASPMADLARLELLEAHGMVDKLAVLISSSPYTIPCPSEPIEPTDGHEENDIDCYSDDTACANFDE